MKWCDDCAHFIPAPASMPEHRLDQYNPCELLHTMGFKVPDHPGDMEWGHYRRGCKDFISGEPDKPDKPDESDVLDTICSACGRGWDHG